MQVISRNDQQLVIQVENFHVGSDKFESLNFFITWLILLFLTLVESSQFFKIVSIVTIIFSSLVFIFLEMKPKPPQRKPRDNYTFDKEADIIDGLLDNEGTSSSKSSEIKNINFEFFVRDTSDDEGISMSTDGEYKIVIEFQNGRCWQLECNQCSFFRPEDSQALFRDLIADSNVAVEEIRHFLKTS